MRFAKIRNGVVENVVEQSTTPQIAGVWVPDGGQPIGPGWLYDEATGLFSEPPATVYHLISAEAFRERFTQAELVDLNVAQQHDPAATNPQKKAAAKLRLFEIDTNSAGYRRLGSNKVQNFVNGLETDGIIAAGRAAAILNTPITADESFNKI